MEAITEIDLGRGYIAIVNSDTFDRLKLGRFRWRANVHKRARKVYAIASVGGSPVALHRFIVEAPAGQMVDHEDNDGLNNRDNNIRVATPAQNRANSRKARDNSSGFKGVSWSPTSRKWVAQLWHNGKRHYLGVYAHKERAARAHDRKAIELHGEFAGLNFPKHS